ncbi:uncharacterized protein LOC144772344 isoform X3 [Lissotriton helveticus]
MAAFPQEDSQGSAGRKSPSRDQIMGEEFTTEMISGSIKEEEGVYPMADQNQEESAKCYSPDEEFTTVIISDSIKEEAYPTADQDTTEFKNALCTAGEEFTKEITSDSIKEEEGAYAMADQNQAELKNFYTPDEEFTTVIISDCIKEEAYPTADQDMKEFKNTLCTAAPSTTQSTGSVTLNDRPNLGDAGHEEHTDGEDSPVIPQKKQRRHIVRPLSLMEGEAEDSDENVYSETTQPQQEVSAQDHQVPQGTARCRRRTTSNNEDRGEESVFAGLEMNMLQVQRLQAKNIKSLQREVRAGFRAITVELRGAMQVLCEELRADRAARRRELQRLDRYTRAINRLASATNILSRRSIHMQREFPHGSQDIATALVQVTSAVDELRAVRTTGPGVLTPSEEDAQSGRSSNTPPPIMERRRSGRNNRPTMSNEDNAVQQPTGASARLRRI